MNEAHDPPAPRAPDRTIDVSVIVPTRNRPRFLARAVASALAQSTERLEVVVVDDGSHDREPVSERNFADPRVRVVRHDESAGVAAARNTGLARATGRWVAFLDDDDIWRPEKIATQLSALERGHVKWCCCSAVHVDERLRIIRYERLATDREFRDRLLACNAIPGGVSGVVCDRELALEVGGFDTRLSALADWDLWIRLAGSSPVAVVGEAQFAYVVHSRGMSANTDDACREFNYVTRKYEQERHQRGVGMNDLAWAVYVAERGEGRTRLATARRRFSALAVRPSPRLAAWAVMPLVPGATRARMRARRNRIPAGERAAIEHWLATVAAPPSPR